MQNAAQNILKQVKSMVPGRFETEMATERTHPHVNWKAYYAVRNAAEGLGFHHVGDVDVISLRHDPSMMKRAVLAVFISEDGTNVLGHYRLAMRWTLKGILARFMGGSGDVFDIGTNFGGGEGIFLETTTAQAAAVWDSPSFIMRETLKRGTALEDVLQRHRERVQDYRRQHPDERPIVARTMRDVVMISDILEQRKLNWRRDRGWVTREELARFGKLDDATLNKLFEAIRHASREQ